MEQGKLHSEMIFRSCCILLDDLLDAGVITEEEYQAARKSLSEETNHFTRSLEVPGWSGLRGITRRQV